VGLPALPALLQNANDAWNTMFCSSSEGAGTNLTVVEVDGVFDFLFHDTHASFIPLCGLSYLRCICLSLEQGKVIRFANIFLSVIRLKTLHIPITRLLQRCINSVRSIIL
jgi:hypothetical protein